MAFAPFYGGYDHEFNRMQFRESSTADKVTTKDGKTVLTLSVTESSPFYQTVEKKFEEKYPEIDLQINAYKTENNGDQGNTRSIGIR